jgi:hypothetical protein
MRRLILTVFGLLLPSASLAQTADYKVVAVDVEDGSVIAVSTLSVRDTQEGFRAFRVAAWRSEPLVIESQGEEVAHVVATGEVLGSGPIKGIHREDA